jgi:uncharacterized Tic20 family protein
MERDYLMIITINLIVKILIPIIAAIIGPIVAHHITKAELEKQHKKQLEKQSKNQLEEQSKKQLENRNKVIIIIIPCIVALVCFSFGILFDRIIDIPSIQSIAFWNKPSPTIQATITPIKPTFTPTYTINRPTPKSTITLIHSTITPINIYNSPTPEPKIFKIPINNPIFDNNLDNNLSWWLNRYEYKKPIYQIQATNKYAHSGEYSLQIDYKKDNTFQFIGVEITSDFFQKNFSDCNTVVVWVYGQTKVLLKLENINSVACDISTQKATIPNDWNKLTFNYSRLAKQIDLTNIQNLLFFIAPGDPNAFGTIYLDDLQFIRQ